MCLIPREGSGTEAAVHSTQGVLRSRLPGSFAQRQDPPSGGRVTGERTRRGDLTEPNQLRGTSHSSFAGSHQRAGVL